MFKIAPLLLGIFALTEGVIGQSPQTIPSTLSCPQCSIVLDTVTILGGALDGPLLRSNTRLIVDHRGRALAAPTYEPGQVAVFDLPTGKFISYVGRRGSGPGEFERITHLAAVGDTLHVFESVRHTTMDPAFQTLAVRILPLSPQLSIGVDGADLLIATHAPSAHQGLVNRIRDNRVVASYGGRATAGHPTLSLRLATGTRRGVVTSPLNQYRLTWWGEGGQPIATIERNPEWFVRWTPDFDRGDIWTERPLPHMTALWEQDGYLWTVTQVADRNWRPTKAPATSASRRELVRSPGAEVADYDGLFDTVIEVLDVAAGAVLTRLRIDEAVHGVAGTEFLYGKTQRDDGLIILRIWRPTIARQ